MADTDDFTVANVYVQDPWYPRAQLDLGPSRPPDAIVRVGLVAEDYLAWRRPAVRYPEKDGQFVLVVPVAASRTAGVVHSRRSGGWCKLSHYLAAGPSHTACPACTLAAHSRRRVR